MNKIKDFKEQTNVKQLLLISSSTNGITNNGSPYLNLVLQDDSGSIDGKYWDVSEKQQALVKAGNVFEVTFDIINYKNNLQAKVSKVEEVDQSTIDLRDFVKQSSVSKEDLQKGLKYYINEIKNPVINKIIVAVLKEYHEDFFEYPAATKNHHNFLGGLATHVLSMLNFAEKMVELYPILSKDLLYAGVILHDIGKLEELSGAFLTEYTTTGKLLGHISIMQAKLYKIACDLGFDDTEEVVMLRHMILTHHGKLEYGSPVLPQIIEADILSYIDNIDARIETLSKAFADTKDNEFTARLFPLENRAFYKHKL